MTEPATPATLSALASALDALLPQTQCGRCGHPEGCAPYARAMSTGEAANRCPPGGQGVADALADRLGRPRRPLDAACGTPDPVPLTARVIEALCIGCGICLDACPVEAIVGAPGVMHVVDVDACTGCRLCLAPCPMDCLEMVDKPAALAIPEGTPARAGAARQRFGRRQARVARRLAEKQAETARRRAPRAATPAPPTLSPLTASPPLPPAPSPTADTTLADDPVARALARLRDRRPTPLPPPAPSAAKT